MKINKNSIVGSLSGTDDNLYDYLPYLLQDLWELGGGINDILELVERNLGAMVPSSMILDLCCGKGAAIINLSKKFNCSGKGIDLFEPFINNAKDLSIKYKLNHLIDFEVMDITEAVETFAHYDIVIYGGDTNVLGDEVESLMKISKCCRKYGYIIYSTVVNSKSNLDSSLDNVGLKVIDQKATERNIISTTNKINLEKIRRRSNELKKKYPAQKKLFYDYIKSQELESFIIENNLICTNLLLQRIN